MIKKLKQINGAISYKDMCAKLNMPYCSGKQKQLQMEDLQRYCEYEKIGTKYLIKKVYNKEIDKIDNRSITLPNIEHILLTTLSKLKEEKSYFASNKDLLKLCYMINDNYFSILNNKNRNSYMVCEKFGFSESFLTYVDKTYDLLKPSLVNALKSMVNKKEILLNIGYKLKKDSVIVNCVSSNSEIGKKIFKIQGESMEELGILKYSDLFGKKSYLKNEYYDLCNSKSKELGIDGFYQCYEIIPNIDKIIYDMSHERIELNGKIKNKIHDSSMLHDLSYNDIEKWFYVLNTKNGDDEYKISDFVKVLK